MELTFWGVRGSYPVARPHARRFGGNTPCVGIFAGGRHLVLDAGTGIRRLGRRLRETSWEGPVVLLISHPHWDHIQGFPFFHPAYRPEAHVQVYSIERPGVSLETLFMGQQRGEFFPVPLEALPATLEFCELREGEARELGPFRVTTLRLNHSGIASGYRIEHGDAVLAYICDVAPSRDLLLAELPPGTDESRALELLYRNQLTLAEGADTVIYDTFFRPAEYRGKEHWGHSTVLDGLEVCRRAGAHSLFMFHHNPERGDDELQAWYEEVAAGLGEGDPRLFVAREDSSWRVVKGGVEPCG